MSTKTDHSADIHQLVMQRENYHRSTPEYKEIQDRIHELQRKSAGHTEGKPAEHGTSAAVQQDIANAKLAGADNPNEPVQGTGQENAGRVPDKQPNPKKIAEPKSEAEAVAHKEK